VAEPAIASEKPADSGDGDLVKLPGKKKAKKKPSKDEAELF